MKLVIGFSTPKKYKIGACLIRWWLGTPYSHVYIAWDSPSLGDSIVYQATMHRVNFMLMEDFNVDNVTIKKYELETDRAIIDKIARNAIHLAGNPYSIRELGQILLMKVPFLTMGDCGGYICSELCATFLIKYFNYKFDKPTYLLSPKDIAEALGG